MAVFAAITTANAAEAPDSSPRRIMTALPGVELEVVHFERDGGISRPYFWARGVPPEEVEAVIDRDPRLSNLQRLERSDDAALYKVDWSVDSPLLRCLVEAGGKVIDAQGSASAWRLKLWFESRRDASTFQRCCLEQEIPMDLEQIKPMAATTSPDGVLSSPQEATLLRAYEQGYFDVPRQVTQEELADELGITSSAVSGRLRRGLSALVRESILD